MISSKKNFGGSPVFREGISLFKPFCNSLFNWNTFAPVFDKEAIRKPLRGIHNLVFNQMQCPCNIDSAIVVVLWIRDASCREQIPCLMAKHTMICKKEKDESVIFVATSA